MNKSKKLLLVLASTFLLAGCNDKEREEPQCPACEQCYQNLPLPGDDTISDEKAAYIKAGQDRVIEIISDYKKLTEDKEIHEQLETIKDNVFHDLEYFYNFDSEEEVIEIVEYAIGENTQFFKDHVIALLSRRLAELLSKIDDYQRHGPLIDIFNNGTRYLNDECETYESIIEQCNSITQEIINSIGGDPSTDKYFYYKEEIRLYGNRLLDQYGEHLERGEIYEKINEMYAQFNTIKSDDEARNLTNSLKDELFNFCLSMFKESLVGAYEEAMSVISDSITITQALEEAFVSADDNIREMRSKTSFDDVYEIYEGAIDNMKYAAITQVRFWGMNQLRVSYLFYEDLIGEGSEKWQELYVEYCRLYSIFEYKYFDVAEIQGEITDLLLGFEEFGHNLYERQ